MAREVSVGIGRDPTRTRRLTAGNHFGFNEEDPRNTMDGQLEELFSGLLVRPHSRTTTKHDVCCSVACKTCVG